MLFSVSGLWFFSLLAYQWYLISTRGQTIAKRWLGMKIIRNTGAPVDFVSGVILRTWISGFLEKLSWLGCLFFIVDSSEERLGKLVDDNWHPTYFVLDSPRSNPLLPWRLQLQMR